MASENQAEGNSGNVLDFQQAVGKRQAREPAASDEELAEYRRMLPILRKMIAEREILMGTQGCPVMKGIFGIPE